MMRFLPAKGEAQSLQKMQQDVSGQKEMGGGSLLERETVEEKSGERSFLCRQQRSPGGDNEMPHGS